MLIDFHTHILPGIDDGSRDEATTEAMLREEARQGVALVVATPHFYANRMSVDRFLEARADALEKAERLRARADAPLPALMAGAEVCYFRGIGQASDIPRLCVDAGRTLLLELPFEQWDEPILRDLKDLINRQKLRLVIAHVERYVAFQRRREVWNRVMGLDLMFQINAGSFLRKDGFLRQDRKKRFCLDFLSEHPDTLLGSDCHGMDARRPNLAAGRAEVGARLGEEALRRIDRAAERAIVQSRAPAGETPIGEG